MTWLSTWLAYNTQGCGISGGGVRDGGGVMSEADCGGCRNEGSHRRHCPRHPNYHPWLLLADRAESIGDSIGVPDLANQAWALAGAIRREMPNHPFRNYAQREAES